MKGAIKKNVKNETAQIAAKTAQIAAKTAQIGFRVFWTKNVKNETAQIAAKTAQIGAKTAQIIFGVFRQHMGNPFANPGAGTSDIAASSQNEKCNVSPCLLGGDGAQYLII